MARERRHPEGGAIRALRDADGEALSRGFRAMGWDKPPSLFRGYPEEQARGEREVRAAPRSAVVGVRVGLHPTTSRSG